MAKFRLRHSIISFFKDFDIKGIRAFAHWLPYFLIPKPKSELIIKTIYGFYLKIDPVKDTGLEQTIYYTGTYEKGTLAIIKHLINEGDVFVDVGANIGLMTLYASNLVKNTGKVYAFEPNPETATILLKNIKTNRVENIEVSQCAIGNKNERVRIYDRWDTNRGSASLIKPNNEGNSYEINIVRLSDFFSAGQKITLIKIDIEGYELEALRGVNHFLQIEFPPMLIVECSSERENMIDSNPKELYNYLKTINSYKIFKSLGGKGRVSKLIEINSISELPNHDNIYCFTKDHIEKLPKQIFK